MDAAGGKRSKRTLRRFLPECATGKTIGAPIALRIENRDWANWEKILPVEAAEDDPSARKLVAPRPGHADLAGSQKFNYHDARYILERASARETAARVAAGAFAKLLLREFDTEIASHTIQVGHVRLEKTRHVEENSGGERGPGFSFAVYRRWRTGENESRGGRGPESGRHRGWDF